MNTREKMTELLDDMEFAVEEGRRGRVAECRMLLLALLDGEPVACDHEWTIDGAHSNEYCKKCFASKPSASPPSREREALEGFCHRELPDLLAQVSAGLLDPTMAHTLIHRVVSPKSRDK